MSGLNNDRGGGNNRSLPEREGDAGPNRRAEWRGKPGKGAEKQKGDESSLQRHVREGRVELGPYDHAMKADGKEEQDAAERIEGSPEAIRKVTHPGKPLRQ